MKIIIGVVATIILGGIFQSFFPFWSLAVAGFIVAMFVGGKGLTSFFYGVIAGCLLWGGYALWLDLANQGLLSSQFGNLFGGLGRPAVLMLTTFLGGLLSGFGTLTGSYLHLFFNKKDIPVALNPDEEIEYKDFKNLRKEWDDQDFA